MDIIKYAIFTFLMLALCRSHVQAEEIKQAEEIRYITDQFEIALQKSKDPNSQVIARIKSGAPVEVQQAAGVDGYAKISTLDNKVGWVLESLLMTEPGGRHQYLVTKKEYEKLKTEFDSQVQLRTEKLSKELGQLKRIATRPLQLQEENQRLKDTLKQERAKFEDIKQENLEFKSIHKDRRWLRTGAVISIGSLVLGLIITRIPWRRRKSWGEI